MIVGDVEIASGLSALAEIQARSTGHMYRELCHLGVMTYAEASEALLRSATDIEQQDALPEIIRLGVSTHMRAIANAFARTDGDFTPTFGVIDGGLKDPPA